MKSCAYGLRSGAVGAGCITAFVALIACSNSNSPSNGGSPPAGNCAAPGAAASGPADTHCVMNGMTTYQTVNPARCTTMDPGASADDGGGGDAAGDDAASAGGDGAAAGDDGGTIDAGDIGNCGNPAFGATMYGHHGIDDDCKYDVTWTSTPICENQPVYFTVTVLTHTGGEPSPVTGANPQPDAVLACAHTSPNSPAAKDPSPETSPGTYTVGPVVFNRPGNWNFRFHFFETCLDQPDAPHGHAAFYIRVP